MDQREEFFEILSTCTMESTFLLVRRGVLAIWIKIINGPAIDIGFGIRSTTCENIREVILFGHDQRQLLSD